MYKIEDDILELLLFPRLRYVGGAIGHRLDIFADQIRTKRIKLSLGVPGVLALERVSIYGRVADDKSSDLIDMVQAPGSLHYQSSVRIDAGQSEQEARMSYGAQKAANGIENGYDHIETAYESMPHWIVEFKTPIEVETIHVSNFCIGSQAYEADTLKFEYQAASGNWIELYNRNSDHIIRAKFEACLFSISAAADLIAENENQLSHKQKLSQILDHLNAINTTPSAPLKQLNISDALISCVESFLPSTLEPSQESFNFHNIPKRTQAFKIDHIQSNRCLPELRLLVEKSEGLSEWLTLEGIAAEVGPNESILSISITFPDESLAHFANGFVLSVRPSAVNECGWRTIYDHAHNVKICQKLAWTAFLAGEDSAKCIGLISKSILMHRQHDATLREAYLWARLNLHGKSDNYKQEVEYIINSSTANDFIESRLQFGRHAFSTPLLFRNQQKYLLSICKTLNLLQQNSYHAMIIYGTLLGAIRNNTFIPHDDDIDLAYISTESNHEGLLNERARIITLFESSGFMVSDLEGHVHLTFSVNLNGVDDPYWVELFPIWKSTTNATHYQMYMNLMTVQSVPVDIIGNANSASTATLNGITLPAPAKPLDFLELRYGPSWRATDRFYEI